MSFYYEYTIQQVNRDSNNCEVCGEVCLTIYYQSEQKRWLEDNCTKQYCHNLFGHYDCLINQRRQ